MIKLTRINRQVIAINPDHISWVEAAPDTTLCLLNGERHLVLESIDELIAKVIEFRRAVRLGPEGWHAQEGDPPHVVTATAHSSAPGRVELNPRPPTIEPPASQRGRGSFG